jgi:hypothetical protein
MAELRHTESERVSQLEAEHVIGRSPKCELRLASAQVSSQHALVRWNGSSWEVKDLGSRNGTFLDGAPLSPAREYSLQVGSQLRFGDSTEDWTLTDDAPPQVMATAADGSATLRADGAILAVPSVDHPEVTLYRGKEGHWLLERHDAVLTIENHDLFEAAGQTWRFCCPSLVPKTQAVEQPLEIRDAELWFGVSSDEEHVELHVRSAGKDIDLGSRTHNYLLLTLARARLEEVARGLPDPLCGWTYQDDLLRALGVETSQLNIDVFRIRKQFASLGFLDAANVIERRPRTKQLRVGVTRLQVARI